MTYIKKLKLLKTPLRDNVIDELIAMKKDYVESVSAIRDISRHPVVVNPYVVTDTVRFLRPELLDTFRSFGVEPTYFVNFGQTDRTSYTTPIHTDISPQAGNKPVPFAINWELTSIESLWRWWDIANAPEVNLTLIPLGQLASQVAAPQHARSLLNGLRYGNTDEFNDQSNTKLGFRVIESQQVLPHTAYLIRTDVPHNVAYVNPSPNRVSISLRFSMTEIPTWEDAVELFAPLIVE
jgi:hypothetical protein